MSIGKLCRRLRRDCREAGALKKSNTNGEEMYGAAAAPRSRKGCLESGEAAPVEPTRRFCCVDAANMLTVDRFLFQFSLRLIFMNPALPPGPVEALPPPFMKRAPVLPSGSGTKLKITRMKMRLSVSGSH